MLIGRVIFGVGMEWLYVAQTALLAFWFDDAYISLALSIFGAGTKVGSLTAVLTGSALGRPVTAFGFGLAICVGSLVCAVVVSLLHEQKCVCDGCALHLHAISNTLTQTAS